MAYDPSPKKTHQYDTIVERISKHAATAPWRNAMRYLLDGENESHEISYGDLESRATQVAFQLLQKVSPGDRVLLLFPPGIEFLYGFLGCLYAGVIAIPAYPSTSGRRSNNVDLIKKDSGAKLILTSEKQHAIEVDLAAKNSNNISDQISGDIVGEIMVISEVPAEGSLGSASLPKISQEGVAFLQYTSGSTGSPKGVIVTHGNIMANMAMITKGYNTSHKSIFVSWLPVFHDMGLIGCTLHPLYSGCEVVQMPPVAFLEKPLRWLKAISKYSATISGAPNFAFDFCLRKISEEQGRDLDLSSLQLLFNGAEPVRPETMRQFYGRFAINGLRKTALRPTYGLAEATLLVAGGPSGADWVTLQVDKAGIEAGHITTVTDQDSRELVGCGEASLQEGIMIVNPETGHGVQQDQVGEIWLKGDNVSPGYWQNPERTKQTFGASLKAVPSTNVIPNNSVDTGYLRTGDLGFIKGGQLFVCGRLKDLMIIGGRNIYPHDVEAVVEKGGRLIRPGSSVVFSIDGLHGEEVVVVAEVDRSVVNGKNGPTAEVFEKIGAYVEQAIVAIGKEFSVAVGTLMLIKPGTLPKTTSGKVQRRECRERFLHKKLDPVFSWVAPRMKAQFDSLEPGESHVQKNQGVREAAIGSEVPRLINIARQDPANGMTPLPVEADEHPPKTKAFSPGDSGMSRLATPQSHQSQQRSGIPEDSKSHRHLETQIVMWLAQSLEIDPAQISPSQTMASLGMDSLVAVELRVHLEGWLKITIPEGAPWEYPTIREFTDFLEGSLKNKVGMGNQVA